MRGGVGVGGLVQRSDLACLPAPEAGGAGLEWLEFSTCGAVPSVPADAHQHGSALLGQNFPANIPAKGSVVGTRGQASGRVRCHPTLTAAQGTTHSLVSCSKKLSSAVLEDLNQKRKQTDASSHLISYFL